ncbi:MAG: hypothetical protein JWO55_368 [Candidatus Saccharibacteria bacterium]|jgi:hypothetical protein|nr:hypothetical protein [Candidatus Saccharibacteria bacterium]
MTKTIDCDQLRQLMYYFSAEKVALFLNAKSPRTLIAWLDRVSNEIPSDEQVSRLEVVYAQFNRILQGEGPIQAAAWLTSDNITQLLRDNQFQQVEDSATRLMMP